MAEMFHFFYGNKKFIHKIIKINKIKTKKM